MEVRDRGGNFVVGAHPALGVVILRLHRTQRGVPGHHRDARFSLSLASGSPWPSQYSWKFMVLMRVGLERGKLRVPAKPFLPAFQEGGALPFPDQHAVQMAPGNSHFLRR